MKKERCFDMGDMQAFIDGELASLKTEKIIKHIALCDACATLLAETEEENTFAFAVLDEELNCLVPTERLRLKVFDSIREIKAQDSWWRKITANIGFADGFSFKSPIVPAFASIVLMVFTLTVGLHIYRPLPANDAVAFSGGSEARRVNAPVETPSRTDYEARPVSAENETAPAPASSNSGFQVVKTGGINAGNTNDGRSGNDGRPQPKVIEATAPAVSPNLSGEDSYLQTIATLSRSVDNNKDMILRPTERVAFERDMAVVDDAIRKMKAEVRKNPDNQAAREVLRASYQNKIDLLNSVAEKTDLMASIQ
jgi:hypothetical protein